MPNIFYTNISNNSVQHMFTFKSVFIQIFQTIQFSISSDFSFSKTFLFQAIQFNQTDLIQTI